MSDYILVTSGGKEHRLRKSDIIKVETTNSHPVIFMCHGEQFVYSHHMKVLEQELNSGKFFRVHKSCLINLERIYNLDLKNCLVNMVDQTAVLIAQRKKAELKRKLRQ